MSFKVFIGLLSMFNYVSSTVLYVVIGMWLERHDSLRRWRLWLMTVLWTAVWIGTLSLAFRPIGPLKVSLGVVLGAAIGAITGLFVKMPETPPPTESNK